MREFFTKILNFIKGLFTAKKLTRKNVVNIEGIEYRLKLNNYAIFQFGRDIGKETPLEAINELSILKDGYTFDGQERLARLIYYGLNELVPFDVCFSKIEDPEVINALMAELEDYTTTLVSLNEEDTEKKKEKVK